MTFCSDAMCERPRRLLRAEACLFAKHGRYAYPVIELRGSTTAELGDIAGLTIILSDSKTTCYAFFVRIENPCRWRKGRFWSSHLRAKTATRLERDFTIRDTNPVAAMGSRPLPKLQWLRLSSTRCWKTGLLQFKQDSPSPMWRHLLSRCRSRHSKTLPSASSDPCPRQRQRGTASAYLQDRSRTPSSGTPTATPL